jgi:hypothetical protein
MPLVAIGETILKKYQSNAEITSSFNMLYSVPDAKHVNSS